MTDERHDDNVRANSGGGGQPLLSDKGVTLKPCPFCGSAVQPRIIGDDEIFDEESRDGFFAVCCAKAGAPGCGAASGWHQTKEECEDAWNRRASVSANQAMLSWWPDLGTAKRDYTFEQLWKLAHDQLVADAKQYVESAAPAIQGSAGCWMVERQVDGRPAWWTGPHADSFDHDPNQGIRFGRRSDAFFVARGRVHQPYTITEHVFVGKPDFSVHSATQTSKESGDG